VSPPLKFPLYMTAYDLLLVGFLAVRKIPLKCRPRFTEGLLNVSETEDPAVKTHLSRIREILLSDRALHDKVS
jgi:ATP-dependent RNA helicase DDX55/SPB4